MRDLPKRRAAPPYEHSWNSRGCPAIGPGFTITQSRKRDPCALGGRRKQKKKKKKKNPIHQVRTACARLASVARHIPLYGLKWHSVAWQPQPCKLTNDLLLEAAALQSRFQLCV
jgi:hypothetical protein